jgi:hypothetical protein
LLNTTPKRAGMALMALAVSSAGVLATVSPASAAVHVPENVVANAPSSTEVQVQWTKPQFGDEPTLYTVHADGPDTDTDGLGPDTDTDDLGLVVLDSTKRAYKYTTAKPSTAYTIVVCAKNGPDENCAVATPAPVITPALPSTGIPPATGPFAPFYTVDAFIKQQYLDWLGRPVRFDELTFWREKLGTGAINKYEFLERLRREPDVDPLEGPTIRLYVAFYLRNPDFGGLEFWKTQLATHSMGIREVADFFAHSSEFQNRYGDFDDAEFVALVYRNVLGRKPDAAGFAYWTRQLQNGLPRGAMMLGFSESSEYKAKTERAVFASEYFADMLERVPTLKEYNAIRDYVASFPDFVNWRRAVVNTILSSAEYKGRIDAGLVSA